MDINIEHGREYMDCPNKCITPYTPCHLLGVKLKPTRFVFWCDACGELWEEKPCEHGGSFWWERTIIEKPEQSVHTPDEWEKKYVDIPCNAEYK